MSPRRSLGILLITGMFAAGCGVGVKGETNQEHATPYLANVSIGSIGVRAVRIVLAGAPAGATASATPTAAPQAYLMGTLVNSSDSADTLTSATVAGGAVSAAGGSSISINLPGQQAVQLGEPDLGLTGPVLTIGASATPLQIGTTQLVTFTFQNAGTTSLQVPVIDSTDVGTTASAAPVSASS